MRTRMAGAVGGSGDSPKRGTVWLAGLAAPEQGRRNPTPTNPRGA